VSYRSLQQENRSESSQWLSLSAKDCEHTYPWPNSSPMDNLCNRTRSPTCMQSRSDISASQFSEVERFCLSTVLAWPFFGICLNSKTQFNNKIPHVSRKESNWKKYAPKTLKKFSDNYAQIYSYGLQQLKLTFIITWSTVKLSYHGQRPKWQ